MLTEFMAIIGTLSPSAIYAELRSMGRESGKTQRSMKLWTLRDCQMELLDGEHHACVRRECYALCAGSKVVELPTGPRRAAGRILSDG